MKQKPRTPGRAALRSGIASTLLLVSVASAVHAQRIMENLDRGVVAVRIGASPGPSIRAARRAEAEATSR